MEQNNMEALWFLIILSTVVPVYPYCGQRSQVLTDVDDTLICPGRVERMGGSLAGMDKEWTFNLPKGHRIYPGIIQFQTEIDKGPSDLPADGIIILTARPELPGGITEIDIKEGEFATEFEKVGGKIADVLYGRLSNSMGDRLERWNAYGDEKIKDQKAYQEANKGKYNFVFVGDNGQGDLKAGRAMLQDPESCVRAVFIHDVANSPARDEGEILDVPVDTDGIYLYRTAADAAVIACQQNLISPAGLQRVITAIKDSVMWEECQTECACERCTYGSLEGMVEAKDVWKEGGSWRDALNEMFDEKTCWCGDCQADESGYPPGCRDLIPEVKAAEAFLKDLAQGCRTDADCPTRMWCRKVCNNAEDNKDGLLKECVPYQREFEACGGTTDSCEELRCEPNGEVCDYDQVSLFTTKDEDGDADNQDTSTTDSNLGDSDLGGNAEPNGGPKFGACSSNITETSGVCGNGKREGAEQCDSNDFAGQSCGNAVSGTVGTLTCTDECTFNTEQCEYSAGTRFPLGTYAGELVQGPSSSGGSTNDLPLSPDPQTTNHVQLDIPMQCTTVQAEPCATLVYGTGCKSDLQLTQWSPSTGVLKLTETIQQTAACVAGDNTRYVTLSKRDASSLLLKVWLSAEHQGNSAAEPMYTAILVNAEYIKYGDAEDAEGSMEKAWAGATTFVVGLLVCIGLCCALAVCVTVIACACRARKKPSPGFSSMDDSIGSAPDKTLPEP
eukprot:TRINITY_DN55032_c0_g1_i1.p1 TRINITY_DN55032_c0_g1~~TRINITY_DN55032_c0_g1_i1.p1  ORF type:complete len:737 (+),score=75.56 TRINITY_DN55032_c0_g1_i1:28-2211(+)